MPKSLKTSLNVALSITISIVMSGCIATNQSAQKAQQPKKEIYVNPMFDGAPSWVMNPRVKGKVVAVGSSNPNVANRFNFQKATATSRARVELSKMLETKILAKLTDWSNQTGSGKGQTFDSSIEQVSKDTTKSVLRGTMIEEIWVNKENVLYVLVSIGSEEVANALGKSLSSFKNQKALYQKFLAEKAIGKLEKELESFNEKENEK